jgi:hypothetical protein
MSDRETIEEAIADGEDAKRCWIGAMKEAGRPSPPPSPELAEGYSGKWQLRAPKITTSPACRARQARGGEP